LPRGVEQRAAERRSSERQRLWSASAACKMPEIRCHKRAERENADNPVRTELLDHKPCGVQHDQCTVMTGAPTMPRSHARLAPLPRVAYRTKECEAPAVNT